MQVGGLAVDGLLAPLKPGGQEPGDGQHAPPQTSGHQEEVEDHADDGTLPVPTSLLQDSFGGQVDGFGGEGLVAGDVVAVGPEPDEENDGHDEVGEHQEDDRLLGVRKPVHVDKEGGLKERRNW